MIKTLIGILNLSKDSSTLLPEFSISPCERLSECVLESRVASVHTLAPGVIKCQPPSSAPTRPPTYQQRTCAPPSQGGALGENLKSIWSDRTVAGEWMCTRLRDFTTGNKCHGLFLSEETGQNSCVQSVLDVKFLHISSYTSVYEHKLHHHFIFNLHKLVDKYSENVHHLSTMFLGVYCPSTFYCVIVCVRWLYGPIVSFHGRLFGPGVSFVSFFLFAVALCLFSASLRTYCVSRWSCCISLL